MSVLIDNYRPSGNPLSAAEFIRKTSHKLDITKTHCLGSGIYGLVHGTEVEDRHKREVMETLRLENPVKLETDAETSDFSWFSINFTELVEEIINSEEVIDDRTILAKISEKDLVNTERYEILKSSLRGISDPRQAIFDAIRNFKKQYESANLGDFLYQPINYLLVPAHYDGIYNSSRNGNVFSTGSVKFSGLKPRNQKYAMNERFKFLEAPKKLMPLAGGKRKKTLRRNKKTRHSYRNRL
jgi:hypothetical protein